MGEHSIRGAGRLDTVVRARRPDCEPRGPVTIVHRLNTRGGCDIPVAAQLVAAGPVAYALDLHSRGRSGGERHFFERVAADPLNDAGQEVSRADVTSWLDHRLPEA